MSLWTSTSSRSLCPFLLGCLFFLLAKIATNTHRRNLRRQRAAARRALWLHKNGYKRLTAEALTRRYNLLANHHSSGPAFNQSFSRSFARSILAMAPKQKVPKKPKMSWRCYNCWRLVTETADKCPLCEGWWQDVADMSYVHKPPPPRQPDPPVQQPAAWSWNAWQTNWQPETGLPQQAARKPSRSASRRTKGRKEKGESQRSQAPAPQTSPFAPIPDGSHPFGTLAPTYNAQAMPSSPWPAPSQTPAPVKRAASPVVDPETLEALRSSYPDVSQAPPRIRAIIEKAEKSVVTTWQDKMNYQTQKQAEAKTLLASAKEAKEAHRAAWLKHLEESASMWKDHMESFKRQQAQFDQMIAKARTDIQEAGDSITQLNKQADVEAAHPHVEKEDKSIAVDTPEKIQQEAALRAKVQRTLQECIDLTTEEDPIDLEDMDEGGAPRKRARSKDPSGREPDDVDTGNGS